VKQSSLWLFSLGLLALSLGALIYVVLRPEGSSYVNVYFSFHQSLPHIPFINNLPSFFHVFAFSLLTVSVLGTFRYAFLTCSVWMLLNLLFEVGQHSSVVNALSAKAIWLPSILNNYFRFGTFDMWDMVFCVVGAVGAYGLTWLFWRKDV
jgi:hypothetical protein